MKQRIKSLETILRDTVKLPEPQRSIKIDQYIKDLRIIREESNYYQLVARRLYKRIYKQEWIEK